MNSIVNRAAVRTVPTLKTLVMQKATLVSGPPRVPISKPEKLVSGIILSIGVVGPAGYILANVQNYRKRGE